jgi:hypothetical protein
MISRVLFYRAIIFAHFLVFVLVFLPTQLAAQIFTYSGPNLPLIGSTPGETGSSFQCPATAGSITGLVTPAASGFGWHATLSILGVTGPAQANVSFSNGQVTSATLTAIAPFPPVSIDGSLASILDAVSVNTTVSDGSQLCADSTVFIEQQGAVCVYNAPSCGTWGGSQTPVPVNFGGGSSHPSDPGPLPSSPANPAAPDYTKPDYTNNRTGCPANATDPRIMALCGNPINAATGNKFQVETDFTGDLIPSLRLPATTTASTIA